jgi:hypothetical protein
LGFFAWPFGRMFSFWLIAPGYSSCDSLSLVSRSTGQQSLHASQARSFNFLVCCLWAGPVAFRVVDSHPSNCLGLATPYYQTSHGHQCRIFIRPWASVPMLSLIQGQQCLNFDSRVNFSSSEFNSMHTLTLTLNARILVAIYQFGCRMSNTKVSPQLATLDGPTFVSGALCRENFHTNGMKSCIDGRIECLTHYWAST